jgi:hypothetical protein
VQYQFHTDDALSHHSFLLRTGLITRNLVKLTVRRRTMMGIRRREMTSEPVVRRIPAGELVAVVFSG